MKGLIFAGLIATLFIKFGTKIQAQSGAFAQPNVLIILTDDQGSVDLGAYGTKDIQTPHLDRLAQSGVRFTQFYAGSAVCSPSRASLLTGKVPHRAGVPGNAGSLRGGPRGLPAEETLAECSNHTLCAFRIHPYGRPGECRLGSLWDEGYTDSPPRSIGTKWRAIYSVLCRFCSVLSFQSLLAYGEGPASGRCSRKCRFSCSRQIPREGRGDEETPPPVGRKVDQTLIYPTLLQIEWLPKGPDHCFVCLEP